MQKITAYESIDKKVFTSAKEAMINDLKIVLNRKVQNKNNLNEIINALLEDNEITKMFVKYNEIITPKPKEFISEDKNKTIQDIIEREKIFPYRKPYVRYNKD